jgi:hypothetical protein
MVPRDLVTDDSVPSLATGRTRHNKEVFMHARLRYALLKLAALLVAQVAAAEPLGRHFTLTPFGGFTMWDGNFRYPGTNPLADNVYAGGRFGYQYNPLLGLEAAFGFSPTREDITGGGDVDYWHASGNLMITPIQGRYTSPFLFAGFGGSRFSSQAPGACGLRPG